jgi:hypothetical protein
MDKETDLAYIAGIIDGEGCITSKLHCSKNGLKRYDIHVGVDMAKIEPLQFIQAVFGGEIHPRRPSKRGKKEHWVLRYTGGKAAEVIEALLPYLLLKRPQAELALRVLKAHPIKYHHYTPIERFLQEADALAIRVLNSG